MAAAEQGTSVWLLHSAMETASSGKNISGDIKSRRYGAGLNNIPPAQIFILTSLCPERVEISLLGTL